MFHVFFELIDLFLRFILGFTRPFDRYRLACERRLIHERSTVEHNAVHGNPLFGVRLARFRDLFSAGTLKRARPGIACTTLDAASESASHRMSGILGSSHGPSGILFEGGRLCASLKESGDTSRIHAID